MSANSYRARDVIHINPPCLVSRSGDIMTDSEYVEVALALPAGIDIARMDVILARDGKQLNISYDWPARSSRFAAALRR